MTVPESARMALETIQQEREEAAKGGFQRVIVGSPFGDSHHLYLCLACGCVVGSLSTHREKCEWSS